MKLKLFLLTFGLFLFTSEFSYAESFTLDLGDGQSSTGRIIQLVLLLTVLSLAPSLLVMMTSFARIIIVLSFLRSAMGVQSTPPNSILIGLALFLTAFIMAPTLERSYNEGLKPYLEQTMEEDEAFVKTMKPVKEFMHAHTREKDLELFSNMAKVEDEKMTLDNMPLRVLIPSFMISELRRAFEIGFLIFLPFLVVDMVVASVLMSMGMMMLPPVLISLPFKLVFFVLIDGWYMLSGSLVESFVQLPASSKIGP